MFLDFITSLIKWSFFSTKRCLLQLKNKCVKKEHINLNLIKKELRGPAEFWRLTLFTLHISHSTLKLWQHKDTKIS